MRRPEDETLFRDMLVYGGRAVEAVKKRQRVDLDSDLILAAALERFIEVIGEAASKVSTESQNSIPEIPWREIIGMRNRLVHGYASVDHDILWDVVSGDLPEIIEALEGLLED